MSATPFRSDAERTNSLADLFGRSLVSGELMGPEWADRIRWLQDNQFLAHVDLQDLDLGLLEPNSSERQHLEVHHNLTTGLDGINQRLGSDPERNRRIVEAILDLGEHCPTVVFAGSVEHAQTLAVLLTASGRKARPIWGELARSARANAIADFREGEIDALTNYGVLHEGFDAPETQAVVIARLVSSDGLFVQMLGRGMRGPKNKGTDRCTLVTTGERLPDRFDQNGRLDVHRYEYLWSATA